MKPAADNAPRNDTARILCACVCSLVALVLTAPSGGARAAAVPQSKEEQAKVWQEIATLPDFWQGTWLSISPIADDFPTPPDYTPSALDYIKRYKPVEDSPFANCQPLGLPFVMNIGGMQITDGQGRLRAAAPDNRLLASILEEKILIDQPTIYDPCDHIPIAPDHSHIIIFVAARRSGFHHFFD